MTHTRRSLFQILLVPLITPLLKPGVSPDDVVFDWKEYKVGFLVDKGKGFGPNVARMQEFTDLLEEGLSRSFKEHGHFGSDVARMSEFRTILGEEDDNQENQDEQDDSINEGD